MPQIQAAITPAPGAILPALSQGIFARVCDCLEASGQHAAAGEVAALATGLGHSMHIKPTKVSPRRGLPQFFLDRYAGDSLASFTIFGPGILVVYSR